MFGSRKISLPKPCSSALIKEPGIGYVLKNTHLPSLDVGCDVAHKISYEGADKSGVTQQCINSYKLEMGRLYLNSLMHNTFLDDKRCGGTLQKKESVFFYML